MRRKGRVEQAPISWIVCGSVLGASARFLKEGQAVAISSSMFQSGVHGETPDDRFVGQV